MRKLVWIRLSTSQEVERRISSHQQQLRRRMVHQVKGQMMLEGPLMQVADRLKFKIRQGTKKMIWTCSWDLDRNQWDWTKITTQWGHLWLVKGQLKLPRQLKMLGKSLIWLRVKGTKCQTLQLMLNSNNKFCSWTTKLVEMETNTWIQSTCLLNCNNKC